MKIPTKDTEGRPNGWLLPIWNANQRPELRPDQVYVTAIAPRSRKGPHLHMRRRGMFSAVSGSALIRILYEGQYEQRILKPGESFAVISPEIPCALYNYGDAEALVLNMPSPAWSAEEPDDHPVTDWKDPQDWPPKNAELICPACGFDFHRLFLIPPHYGKDGQECPGA